MSENTNIVEMHGCIVCGKVFNILAVYSPEGRFLIDSVTRVGGHCIAGEKQPLVACDTHTADQIDVALKRWQARKTEDQDEEKV
jgi:hypothetical protein